MKALLLFVIAIPGLAIGATNAVNSAKPAKLTPEQRREAALKRTGGTVVEPGSGSGFVAIVNRQGKVGAADIGGAIDAIRKDRRYVFKIVGTEEEAKGAALTVRIVDEAGKPPMIAAPEASWAEVNVAGLVPDLPGEKAKAKFTVIRARKMILRAFAYAAGAGGSGFPGNVLDITELRDLDYCQEFIPMDAVNVITKHLAKRGLEPERAISYRFACEEGWAPAPTNEYQKAIYEEIKNPEKRWDKDFGG